MRVVSVSRHWAIVVAGMVLSLACAANDEQASANHSSAIPSEATAVPAVCERSADMPPALKLERYRGVTPACVPNGTTLDVAGLQALLTNDEPVLIDVWAIIRSVDDGFGSMWLQNEDHYSLPGAVWLPNVGYGKIKPDIEEYLLSNLQQLTAGDKHRALVFFCVADCWMSWNTVQRVYAYGYPNVYWFKEGTDGWEEAGLPLHKVAPVELTVGSEAGS